MTAISYRPTGATSEARIAKALAHPLRARILARLGERVASPGELATELDAPLGVVSYHVRMLRDYGCVELVRTEPRRGALQHFYRAIARPDFGDALGTLPVALLVELAGETMATVIDELGGAAAAGTLGGPAVMVTRDSLELDQRGQAKLNKLLARTRTDALAIAHDSAARLAEHPDRAPIATTLSIQHFERPVAAHA